jgi:phenylacetate-CoA ligase
MQAPSHRLRLLDWRWPLWRALERARGRHASQYYAKLLHSQYLTPVQHAARTQERLAELLTHASSYVPYYRALGCGTDLNHYPVLTRQGLLRNRQALRSERPCGELMTRYTSGTTGERVEASRDWRAQEMSDACIWRGDGWGSTLAPADRQLHLRYDPRHHELPPSLLATLASFYYNRFALSGFVINAQAVREIHSGLHRLRPRMLCSYPSTLIAYVRFARELQLKPPPLAKVVLISEQLEQRDALEFREYFGCTVSSRYGANELGVIADQCEHGAMHLHGEHICMEVLSATGAVASRGAGTVLCTTLSNLAMPLIRYEISDWAELGDGPCPCGRGLPLLLRLEGRAGQFVYGRDGRWISAYAFLEPLYAKPTTGLRVIQDEPGRVRVLLENSRLTDADFAEVRKHFDETHEGTLDVDFVCVSELPPTPSGKRCSAQCLLPRPENIQVR